MHSSERSPLPKPLMLCAAAALAGCTISGATALTSWGKSGISMLDYRTDAGQCAVLAVTTEVGTDVAKSAGGISGQNSGPSTQHASGSASAAPGNQGSAGNNLPTVSGSTYRDSAPPDFVNRAAMQQRTQEMAEQRARGEALKECLMSRGYTEFELTSEQRAQLLELEEGSEQRREYLYRLGTNPEVLDNQSVEARTARGPSQPDS